MLDFRTVQLVAQLVLANTVYRLLLRATDGKIWSAQGVVEKMVLAMASKPNFET